MKQVNADRIKAEATRALLTCRCGHMQTEHLHTMKEGMVVGRWLACLEQGCRCQAFLSTLTARDKATLDTLLDDKVAASQLAAVLSNQAPQPNGVIPTLRYPAATPPKRTRAQRRQKERVRSANNAGVSGLYHGTATKTAKGKYLWEE